MEKTPLLNLPLVMPSQAQANVTHNEALMALDCVVQLSVIGRNVTDPPGGASEGDRYIVPAGATGDWVSKQNAIAVMRDGGWMFVEPRDGWRCWDETDEAEFIFDGSVWVDVRTLELQNLEGVGIGGTYDGATPLAVHGASSLFSGASGHQLKLNKPLVTDTAAVMFQTDYSGRAEFGLTGDDDFHVKVSPDGSTWHEGLVIDKDTGEVSFPNTSIGSGGSGREMLTANRTYYVRTDGDDSNDGLVNNAGGAFATIQKAIDAVAALDLSIHDVTIQLGNAGTYAGATVSAPFVGGPGSSVTLAGDTGSPGSYVLSSKLRVENCGQIAVQGVDFTSSDWGIDVENLGLCLVTGTVIFGACSSGHMQCQGKATIKVTANYTIDGGAPWHILCGRHGYWSGTGLTITLTGTPAFSTEFANTGHLSFIDIYSNTFIGSATGVRYVVNLNSEIFTAGGGATYLPGDSAGSTATGGLYV